MIETFKPYLQRFKWLLLTVYVAGLAQTVASSITPLAGKVFFDYVLPRKVPDVLANVAGSGNFDAPVDFLRYIFTDVRGFVVFAFFFALLLGILQTIRDLAGFLLQNRMTAQINTDLFGRIMYASLQKHQSYDRGYLNARIMADSGAFESLARNLLPSLVNNLLRFTAGLVILSGINLRMTLVCLGTAPIYLLSNWFFAGRARRLAQQSAEQAAANYAFVQNSLHGIETIKALNLEPDRINGFADRLKELINTRLRFFKTGVISSIIARSVQVCCLLLLLVMAERFYSMGQMTPGDIIAFVSYMGFLSGPLASLATLYINLQPNLVAVGRVREVLAFAGEGEARTAAGAAQNSVKAVENFVESPDQQIKEISQRPERLELKKVSCYHNSDMSVFADLDMQFVRGKTTIIDWQSGLGKTTLARLLLKFLQPDSGQILLDGVSLADIDTTALRAIVGYKPQTDFFFAGSIRDNLLVARPGAETRQINEALQLCCAEDFVLNRRDALEHQLSDGAMNLSEGQRQRLALARAILRDSGILILDEPFAAIDTQTSARISANLQEFMSGRICIIMSHQKTGKKENRICDGVE